MSTAHATRSAEGERAVEIKLIHIGRTALRLDDEQYRGLISGVSGGRTSSSKGLTAAERQMALQRLKALGFELKPKAKGNTVALIREAQLRKLRAMWYALADVGEVARPANADACTAAVEAWAKSRLPGLEALRFATGHDMGDLIEQMKRWGDRVGADVHQATPKA